MFEQFIERNTIARKEDMPVHIWEIIRDMYPEYEEILSNCVRYE